MHGKHLAAALVAALGLTLSLASCGGGGGGGGPKTMAQAQAELDANDVRATDPEKTAQSASRAATSLPHFGSVTQSANRDANGVTTDRAGAAFDGAGLTVTVMRADSSTLTVDTADAVDSDSSRDTFTNVPGASRTWRTWSTLNVSGRSATLAGLGVTSANGSPSDWLAGGYWLHIAGENLLASAPTVTSADIGAFVDGPELRSPPSNLPGTGTARYEGLAAGAYYARGGTRATVRNSTGGFGATATLTANFGDNTIRGCIGCRGDVRVIGVEQDSTTGEWSDFDDTSNIQLRLGAAQINSDGTFRVQDVTTFWPEALQAGLTTTEEAGSWGGGFSNVPVTTGEPRLAAGTFGSTSTLSDGTNLTYVGAFISGKQ